ncbi:MAG: ribosome maturation factor RimP [Sutterellaceae bacterium]|nr:ribosome maturation factor RimP [Sutterellaceae bacterium]
MLKSTAEIIELVETTVEGLGFEFVEFERLPRGMMRVTIDSTAAGGVSVNDCEMVSDQVTHLFTVEGIEYDRLEVSSPGVERPLKRVRDWRRFVGQLAHVELYEPMHAEGFPEAGRRKLDGRILGVEGDEGMETIKFSFEEIEVAKTPSQAARAKAAKTKKVKAEPIEVSFAFNDVDRANLIAQLDFKGKQK